MLDGIDISRQCARGFFSCPDAFGSIFDGGLHVRMAGVAKLAKVPRKVARTDEEAINPFDGRDCLDFL